MKRICSLLLTFCLGFFLSQSVYAAKDVETSYLTAKSCYGELKVSPKKAASRAAWDHCIDLFKEVHDKFQNTDKGAPALFSMGKLNVERYAKFHKEDDATSAIKFFNQLVREYPKNSLADDALFQIGKLRHNPFKDDERAKVAFSYIVEKYPNGDMEPKAKQELESLDQKSAESKEMASSDEDTDTGPEMQTANKEIPKEAPKPSEESPTFLGGIAGPRAGATITQVDIQNGEVETSVSLKLTRRATYSLTFEDLGRHTKSPPVLDMLIAYTKPSQAIARSFSVSSPYLNNIKLKKSFLGGGTRFVFEMKPNSSYEVKAKGECIIVYFRSADGKKTVSSEGSAVSNQVKEKGKTGPVIVIDPGHGGGEAGAMSPGGLKEKDVVLSISKKLANRLKEDLGAKVYLTRSDDKTLSLEDRNAVAVSKKADLFISVHANASTDHKMTGIETYFLNNASDEAAAKLAKRENKSAQKKLSDVEHILSTMLQNYDAAESQVLAAEVQKSLMTRMNKQYTGVKNRKVRSALFYVLVGAKCPAILVETSFISNPKEAERLKNKNYQNDLAISILDGVRKYIKLSEKRIVAL